MFKTAKEILNQLANKIPHGLYNIYVGRAVGLNRAPEHHVVPIYKCRPFDNLNESGLFDRFEEGVFRYKRTKEKCGSPCYFGFRVITHTFKDLTARDEVDLDWEVEVRVISDPRKAGNKAKAAKWSKKTIEDMIIGRTNHALRREIERIDSHKLKEHADEIENNVANRLRGKLSRLGITVLEVQLLNRHMSTDFKKRIAERQRLEELQRIYAADGELDLAEKMLLAMAGGQIKNNSGNMAGEMGFMLYNLERLNEWQKPGLPSKGSSNGSQTHPPSPKKPGFPSMPVAAD